MTTNNVTIGRYLENARQDAGLSLRQLAEAADVQLTMLARLLRDETRTPKPDHLVRLANVLELRSSELFRLAGLAIPEDIGSVEALLRTEYELPDEAIAEAQQHIEAIVKRYKQQTNRKEDPNGN